MSNYYMSAQQRKALNKAMNQQMQILRKTYDLEMKDLMKTTKTRISIKQAIE